MNLVGKEGIQRMHVKVLSMYRDYLKQCFRIKANSEERKNNISMVREAFATHKVTENFGESTFLYSYAKSYYFTFTNYVSKVIEVNNLEATKSKI